MLLGSQNLEMSMHADTQIFSHLNAWMANVIF